MSSAAPPRSATLDLLIGIVGVWLAAGFLWDSWAHLHVSVETFFTPYHAIFYAAMLVGAAILGVAALRNRADGYTGGNLLPLAYRVPLLGIPLFFLAGVGDLIWHTFFGVEDRVDAVTSPTHILIGLGVLLVLSAPIRSALSEREKLTTLRAQLPLLFALAAWLEFIHLGTAYAFDPSAARMYAPPNDVLFTPDFFTATSLVLYKTGSGVAIVILQTLILMTFTLWLVTRFRLAPGALTLFFVLGNGMIAAALTNDTPLLATYLAMSVVAGVVGDALLARLRPSTLRPGALRIVGLAVPPVYYGTYFAVTLMTGGTWWDWNLILGALVWSACAGGGLALLAAPPR
jgi:hypothetical protein